MQPTHNQIEWENFNAQWDERVCISYIFLLLWTMGVSKRPLSLTYVQCIQSLLSSTVFEASWLFPKNIFKRVQWVQQPSVLGTSEAFSQKMGIKCSLGLAGDDDEDEELR